jgi:hypothetical protein
MIIKTITQREFSDAFARAGRAEQFSSEALEMLYGHLDDASDEAGQPYELDVIGICCEYSEQAAAELAADNPGAPQRADYDDDDEHTEAVADWLRGATDVIGITSEGWIVYADY